MDGGTIAESDMPARRPTIRDVARLAGVSKSTVSLVLRGAPSVRSETADRVRAAMTRMNYVYDARAVRFRQARSGPVGIVVADMRDALMSELLEGILPALSKHGLSAMLAVSEDGGRAAVSGLRSEGVSALLLDGRLAGSVEGAGHIPVLTLLGAGSGGPTARVDTEQALRLCGQYLRTVGSGRLWVCGPAGRLGPPEALKAAGFEALDDGQGMSGRLVAAEDGVVCLEPGTVRAVGDAGVAPRRTVAFGWPADPGIATLRCDLRALGRSVSGLVAKSVARQCGTVPDIFGRVWLQLPVRC